MRSIAAFAALALLVARPAVAADGTSVALETPWCIPDLPYARIQREFSAMLEKGDCSDTMAKANTGTHLLGIHSCRDVESDAGVRCKSFAFQINNANSQVQASGVRFVMKGSGRWCRRSSNDWTAVEPEIVNFREIMRDGPPPPQTTCADPPRPTVASLAPRPAPVVRPPFCAADYRPACGDLVALRYLETQAASDDALRAAVVTFLADERETRWRDLPNAVELGRLTGAALERSRRRATCTPPPPAGTIACGRT